MTDKKPDYGASSPEQKEEIKLSDALSDRAESGWTAEWVDMFRRRFEATKNPIYVWRAIPECRRTGTTLPGWVVDYLAEVSWNLEGIVQAGKSPGGPIARALKMTDPRGGRLANMFSNTKREDRNRAIIKLIETLTNEPLNSNISNAYDVAASTFKLSDKRIMGIWTEARDEVDKL